MSDFADNTPPGKIGVLITHLGPLRVLWLRPEGAERPRTRKELMPISRSTRVSIGILYGMVLLFLGLGLLWDPVFFILSAFSVWAAAGVTLANIEACGGTVLRPSGFCVHSWRWRDRYTLWFEERQILLNTCASCADRVRSEAGVTCDAG